MFLSSLPMARCLQQNPCTNQLLIFSFRSRPIHY
uniref:Uncharacterized protein n=1 Tax=Arundo donax TaxID=35708 RepID=A0A0A9HHZ6_ARUDO